MYTFGEKTVIAFTLPHKFLSSQSQYLWHYSKIEMDLPGYSFPNIKLLDRYDRLWKMTFLLST